MTVGLCGKNPSAHGAEGSRAAFSGKPVERRTTDELHDMLK